MIIIGRIQIYNGVSAKYVSLVISKIEDLLSKLIKLKSRKTCLSQLSKKKST